LDIECPAELEFPSPDKAKYEIDLMTVYDSLTGFYHIWGKHEFTSTDLTETFKSIGGEKFDIPFENIKYYEIFDEAQRLGHFVDFWESNYPDIYTGYNINGFDTQYIVNRLKLILGYDAVKRLSPVNFVSKRETLDAYKNPVVKYNIEGISTIDYMDLYKVFTFGKERESWALDSVASDVLGCGKVDTGGVSLFDLSRNDWDTYTRYNIVDVALLVEMEKKLRFIEIGRSTAYEGFSNVVDCLGKVVTITGSIAKYALDENRIIETRRSADKVPFEGGFVKTPEAKLRTNIVTYDITSLYPTNMMVLGVSHETKVGTKTHTIDGYVYFTEYGEQRKIPEKDFHQFLVDNKYCISLADVIFDQKKEGIINKFVKKQFNNKSEYSRLSKEALSKGDTATADEYARLGQITKIFLNSCYGVISTSKSPLYDLDIARSITLTGQAVIKKADHVVSEFAKKHFNVSDDVVIGGDTDSIFCDFTEIVKTQGKPMFVDNKLTEFGSKLCVLFEQVLNRGVNNWIHSEHNCIDPTYNFEREKAATTALFFAKKQYAYHVVNNEGFDLDKDHRMKYTGLKVVRSEYSPMVKGMMNELYESVLQQYLDLGHDECGIMMTKLVKAHKKKFMSASFYDISKRQKVNNIIKYEKEFISEFVAGSRCPAQVKASVCYNRLVTKLGLRGKYQLHRSGIKSLWVYVLENKYGITNIAGNGNDFPEEFELDIDVELMFEKLYLAVAKQLFSVVGWRFPNIHYEESLDLHELFS